MLIHWHHYFRLYFVRLIVKIVHRQRMIISCLAVADCFGKVSHETEKELWKVTNYLHTIREMK